jgi:hypothetical protein
VRLGGGYQAAINGAQYGTTGGSTDSLGFAILGGELRVGVQIDERFGIDVQASFGTALVDEVFRGALVGVLTPVDWISVGAGSVIGGNYSSFLGQGQWAVYAGQTLRVDFHPNVSENRRGFRRSFTVGIAADLGVTIGGSMYGGPGLAWGLYTTIGQQLF